MAKSFKVMSPVVPTSSAYDGIQSLSTIMKASPHQLLPDPPGWAEVWRTTIEAAPQVVLRRILPGELLQVRLQCLEQLRSNMSSIV